MMGEQVLVKEEQGRSAGETVLTAVYLRPEKLVEVVEP